MLSTLWNPNLILNEYWTVCSSINKWQLLGKEESVFFMGVSPVGFHQTIYSEWSHP